ncbi:MAG TPA: hypothetical protein VGO00_00760 [Kofleriaceae bacterium]|nr:hypothetical protein [Kofleriaceae bacterium]
MSSRASIPALLCVTGASGAGKTTIVRALPLTVLHFDSLGVPPEAEMIAGWGSGERWQEAMTAFWIRTACDVHRTKPVVVLEGQFDPRFARTACEAAGVVYAIAVLDVADEVRRRRLTERGQPELASDQMMNWGRYLREASCDAVIDTDRPVDVVIGEVASIAQALVDRRLVTS